MFPGIRGSNQTGTLIRRAILVASPSVLALCRIKRQPEGLGTGSLGQVASRLTGQPYAPSRRNGLVQPLSDVPPGCPKGICSVHHWFAETRKGVPTNEGRHAQCAHLDLQSRFAKAFFAGFSREKPAKAVNQAAPPVPNRDAGSTFTPGPMVEEIATRLM
jgi:hypothetical protein